MQLFQTASHSFLPFFPSPQTHNSQAFLFMWPHTTMYFHFLEAFINSNNTFSVWSTELMLTHTFFFPPKQKNFIKETSGNSIAKSTSHLFETIKQFIFCLADSDFIDISYMITVTNEETTWKHFAAQLVWKSHRCRAIPSIYLGLCIRNLNCQCFTTLFQTTWQPSQSLGENTLNLRRHFWCCSEPVQNFSLTTLKLFNR